jgi:hypothetical protein
MLRGEEAHARLAVRSVEPGDQGGGDGAHRDVDRLGLRRQDAVLAKGHRFHRRVVGEHGHHHIALRGLGGAGGADGAFGDQHIGLGGIAVPYGQPMPRLGDVAGDADAHMAETDDADFHEAAPLDPRDGSPRRRLLPAQAPC